MISGTENRSQTLDSPFDIIEVKHEGEPEMGSLKNNSASEVTHESVNERMKLVAQLILWQFEKLCALLRIQNKFETQETANLPVRDVMACPQSQRTTGMI